MRRARRGFRAIPLAALWLSAVLAVAGAAAAACAAPTPAADEAADADADKAADESRRMAITIDDLPVAPPGRHTTVQQEAITERLLAVFAEHSVPAIGFVNESKLAVDGAVDLLLDPRARQVRHEQDPGCGPRRTPRRRTTMAAAPRRRSGRQRQGS